jgi:nucleoid-associated protein YgaU
VLPAASIVALAAAAVGLVLLGRGELAAPPLSSLTSPERLRNWFDARPPAVAVFALLRLAALGLAGYLVALAGLTFVARLTSSPSMLRATDAAIPPGARRVTAALLGVGLVGAAAGPLLDGRTGRTETLVMVDRLVPGQPVEVLVPLDGDDPDAADGSATLRRLAPDKPGSQPAAPQEWVVARGDHLWSIAEAHLGDVLGRPPTDAEITPYWRALIDHNRSRLSDPDLPDMIFPGQVFELPPPI